MTRNRETLEKIAWRPRGIHVPHGKGVHQARSRGGVLCRGRSPGGRRPGPRIMKHGSLPQIDGAPAVQPGHVP
jgi:hypothetical protein